MDENSSFLLMPILYTIKIIGDLVKVINLNTGSVVSSINVKPYRGLKHAHVYVNENKIVIVCGDGKTRVFKPSGTLEQSY